MFRTLLSACLFGCIAIPSVFAAAPPGRPLAAKEMAALIEKLHDRDFRVRELADRQLRAQGEAALPALKKALAHQELEVRRRAMRLIPVIETARLFAPKRVTLRVTNESLPKVLEALSKASGYKVMDGNGGGIVPFPFRNPRPGVKDDTKGKDRTYTYDILEEPFWDVVERICRDANLSVQQSGGDDSIRLAAGNGHAPFTGRHGPFRYVGQSLQLYRNVDLGSSKALERTETLTFNFTIFAEPRLPFMNMGEPRIEAAYDDLNNTMVVERNQNVPLDEMLIMGGRGMGRRYYGGNYKQLTMTGSVPLVRGSTKATKVKLLKGVVPLTILVEQKPIALTDKVMSAKGTKKVVGDLTFEIKEVKKQPNNQVQVQFTITNKQGNDYTWQNNLYNRIELYDDKGNKMSVWGSSWGGTGPNNVQMTLTFGNGNVQKPGEPAKFVFQHWEMKQHNVEFTFRDVPLP